jgi:hypothetical protein
MMVTPSISTSATTTPERQLYGQWVTPNIDRRSIHLQKGLCFVCNEKGHTQYECPSRQETQELENTFLYRNRQDIDKMSRKRSRSPKTFR